MAGKRVFVPGCGRGYDLVEFARAGAAAAVGLELAPTAQRAAAAYVAGQLSGTAAAAAAEVHSGDFFKWTHQHHAAWDVGFDYTFMWCAVWPKVEASRLLEKPGRRYLLLCMDRPTDRPTPPASPTPLQRPAPRHAAGLGGSVGSLPGARRALGLPGVPN